MSDNEKNPEIPVQNDKIPAPASHDVKPTDLISAFDQTVERIEPIVTPEQVMQNIPQGTNVILIGEAHGAAFKEMPIFAKKLLPQLKEQGFTTLAIEVDSQHQPDYDRYMRGEITIDQLAQIAPIAKFRNEDLSIREEGREFIETAKKLGFKLVCIDNWNPQDDRTRDEHMAAALSQMVQSGEKIVFYVGAFHASKKLGEDRGKLGLVDDVNREPTGYLLSQGEFSNPSIRTHSIALYDPTARTIFGGMPRPKKDKYDFVYKIK